MQPVFRVRLAPKPGHARTLLQSGVNRNVLRRCSYRAQTPPNAPSSLQIFAGRLVKDGDPTPGCRAASATVRAASRFIRVNLRAAPSEPINLRLPGWSPGSLCAATASVFKVICNKRPCFKHGALTALPCFLSVCSCSSLIHDLCAGPVYKGLFSMQFLDINSARLRRRIPKYWRSNFPNCCAHGSNC